MKSFYTPAEVAKILHISYRRVLDEIVLGRLDAIQIGRQYRISDHDLESYIKKCKYAAFKFK